VCKGHQQVAMSNRFLVLQSTERSHTSNRNTELESTQPDMDRQ